MTRPARSRKAKLPAEPVTLTIQRLSHDGRGIASQGGKIAFVSGALPGETVRARYTHSRSQFDELDCIEVLSPSPERVSARCAVFDKCGGCNLQHLSPDAQIAYKRKALADLLCNSLGQELTDTIWLNDVVADSYHYRRKARLAVRYVSKKGGTLVGFREKHGTFIVDMQECPVLVQPASELIRALRLLIDQLDARQQIPQVEIAAGENAQGALQVAMVIRHLQPLSEGDGKLLDQFAARYRCDLYLQPGGPESIQPAGLLPAPGYLNYRLPEHQLIMQFHPLDFTQVNGEINRRMIRLALELLDPKSGDRALDLFCGLGNFTLPLAQLCQEVIGVEGNLEMVERAQANARLNGIANAGFHVADLREKIAGANWNAGRFDLILLDPPRSGAQEIIFDIARMLPRRILYISCNPATLARDAALLLQQGYRLERVGVVDMFPHTAHVESIAVFIPAVNRALS